jgi:hypothetical protein
LATYQDGPPKDFQRVPATIGHALATRLTLLNWLRPLLRAIRVTFLDRSHFKLHENRKVYGRLLFLRSTAVA